MAIKYIILLFLSFLLVILPMTRLFANSDITNPSNDATSDAQRDVNSILWGAGGCLFGLIGVAAAYIIDPLPPATRLIGKESTYTAIYTDTYRSAVKSIRGKAAITGCLISSVVYLISYFGLFAAASSYSSSYYATTY